MPRARGGMELIPICPGAHLLRVPEQNVAWLFGCWPDAVKFLIQRGLGLTGVVYPDLRFQGEKGTSYNLVEFPLLYALFNEGMLARGERPQLLGTPPQLALAGEAFRRGLYGYCSADEMAGCDLDQDECRQLMREIEGLSPVDGIQPVDSLLDLAPLAPLEQGGGPRHATEVAGIRIWKESPNVFGVRYRGQRLLIDGNLPPGQSYRPPMRLDSKQIAYGLFQIVDTGEEDGFSPRSCMHTLIQWRDRIICIDLPMNVSYLLERVSVSRFEIDAVLFTHNHDDHMGELGMLLHMHKKLTVICPRIVWRSILLKGAAMLGMTSEELASFFDYVPLRYGEELDYAGLRILAHPSIHSVPCAVYRLRGIVGNQWQSYGHMSDILNFRRCQTLVEKGIIGPSRFAAYRDFVLQPTTVKKIDVGATAATLEHSVHGFWRDFEADRSEHIVLGHIRAEMLDERATVTVGQVAVAGSAREVGVPPAHAHRDRYRERAIAYLTDHVFSLANRRVAAGLVTPEQVWSYVRILADGEIRVIQPNTPFLKRGGDSTYVDLVIAGTGSVWLPEADEWRRVASVNAGDLIGDMGVLLKIPRTATIRSDSYMRVLRIPCFLFGELAALLGLFHVEEDGSESALQRMWRLREFIQRVPLLSAEVPLHIQNRIAQEAVECTVEAGAALDLGNGSVLLVGADAAAFSVQPVGRGAAAPALLPVFGESGFLWARPEPYTVTACRQSVLLRLDRHRSGWILDVPVLRLRLGQLAEAAGAGAPPLTFVDAASRRARHAPVSLAREREHERWRDSITSGAFSACCRPCTRTIWGSPLPTCARWRISAARAASTASSGR